MLRKDLLIALFCICAPLFSGEGGLSDKIQNELNKRKTEVSEWAADAVIIKAVKEQNAKGPIAGMDNAAWKLARRDDSVVLALQQNPAAKFLKDRIRRDGSAFNEAFLCGALGEKVAFCEKTSFYNHAGIPKFDVPFKKADAWQGPPEFDESSQTYAIQLAVPVLDGGKPIGVLVVGVNLSHLERIAGK